MDYVVQDNILIYACGVVVLLIILSWIYVKSNITENQHDRFRKEKVNETIEWLYQVVNDVCYRCNMSPVYNIVESTEITYTDKLTSSHTIKGCIYLVIWDDTRSRIFNHNTLIYAILHEIAHILSPSVHHEPPFNSIESLLLNTAITLGYYDPSISIESHYTTTT